MAALRHGRPLTAVKHMGEQLVQPSPLLMQWTTETDFGQQNGIATACAMGSVMPSHGIRAVGSDVSKKKPTDAVLGASQSSPPAWPDKELEARAQKHGIGPAAAASRQVSDAG